MNQSVIKALKLLDLFTEGESELSLNVISERSGMPKATAFRLLASLESMGFLSKSKNSIHDVTYTLGLKLLELGGLVADQMELRKTALPLMQQLCAEVNETVHLVILDGDEAVYIEKVESSHALRLYTRVGRRSSLYLGSGPQLLLAYLPEQERQMLISHMSFQQVTDNTVVSTVDLENKVQQIREAGYAISHGEQDMETTGVSYPIYDHTERVIAALNVSGPSSRFQGEHEKIVQKRTRDTALQISFQLGYPMYATERRK